MKTTLTHWLVGLAVLGTASMALATTDVLEPESAVSEVANSSGLVLVNLYADW
jgi:hypothetical protein